MTDGVTTEPVSFAGYDGTTLRGTLHRPAGAGRHAAVSMCHGFSGTRGMGVQRSAAVLADAGLVALAWDHRNFGASDGEPRGEIDPFAQMRDGRHALSFLGGRPEVDEDRLACWGSSFSGGEALVLGAVDPRVRAVVAQVPFAGTGPGVDDPDGDRFSALRAAVVDDDAPLPGAHTAPLGPMPVVADDGGVAFLPDPHAATWFRRAATPDWRNEVTVRSLLADPPFDPGLAAAHVHAATLLVVAREDALAPPDVAAAAYARIPAPKRLEWVDGHHFVVYEQAFDHVARATVAFLHEHLA